MGSALLLTVPAVVTGSTAAAAATAPTLLATIAITTAVSAAVSIGASFAINALQPGPATQEVGKIEDTQVFTSEEGTNIMRCFGERCRVGGTVLWIGALQEYIIHETDELSGFPVKRFKYQRDIAVGICHGPVGDGDPEHGALKAIYANGIPILNNPGEVSVSSEQFYVEQRSAFEYPGFGNLLLGVLGIGIMRIHQIKEEASANPDLDNLEDYTVGGYISTAGEPTEHHGFDNFLNNGWPVPGVAMQVMGTGQVPSTDPYFDLFPNVFLTGSHYVDLFNPFAQNEEGHGHLITLEQTYQIISQLQGFGKYYIDLNFHRGTEDQEPDDFLNSELVGILPLNSVLAPCYPAYRGLCYIVIGNLQLEDFGNTIPKLEFEIEERRNRNVGDTIADMLGIAGLVETDFTIDPDVFNIPMRGYVIPGPVAMNKALTPILRAYNIVVQEANDGKLRFMKRNAGTVWVIEETDLAAHEIGEAIPRPLEITDVPDDALPEQVNITFVDTSLNLQRGSQRERRINLTNRNVMDLQIPLTLNPEEARSIAARELWLSIINRQTVTLRLPPSYVRIKENDILKVTADGNDYRIIVTKVERGNNFIMLIEGYLESEESMDFSNAPGESPSVPAPILGSALVMPSIIDKGSPIFSSTAGTLGVYVSLLNISTNPFTQAQLLISVGEAPVEEPTNIHDGGFINKDSDFGVALTLPSLTAREGVWDTESKITIEMRKGTIESATEETCYFGTNWARLGKEIIAFRDVSFDEGTEQYIISHLLRGLRDTADEISTHALDPNVEMFVLLTGNKAPTFIQIPEEFVGQDLYIGARIVGQAIDTALWAAPFTFVGHSGKPFRTNNLEIRRKDGTDNIWVTWAHAASRHYAPFTNEVEPGFLEPFEFYRVKVFESGTLVRTETRVVPYWVYNTTDQTADGITPGTDTFTIEVYEVSDFGESLLNTGTYSP